MLYCFLFIYILTQVVPTIAMHFGTAVLPSSTAGKGWYPSVFCECVTDEAWEERGVANTMRARGVTAG